MDVRYKDIISGLPEALICHILSFLPTKEVVSTSVLSKQWRYLFALSPNLDFDDTILYIYPEISKENREKIDRMFIDLVDRVLRLQENFSINKFSLKCGHGVHGACISRWVLNVLKRGLSDLDLRVNVNRKNIRLGSVFVSNSLVRLRIDGYYPDIDVDYDIFLPKIKTLHLDKVSFGDRVNCTLFKLVSGCPSLEELVLIEVFWNDDWNRSVSSKTLKRLTLRFRYFIIGLDNVSFDTPNLVYFDYTDHVAKKYEIVNFESLVEARIALRMTRYQVTNAKDLFMRINNVQILYLSSTTLEVLTFCCEQIPVFKNLSHLTIQTDWSVGWESLTALLKNCPKLETLVIQGLHHINTTKCEEVEGCLCKSSGTIPSFLSSSPVKVIKIFNFGEISSYCNDMEKQMEKVKYFLEIMPNLEEMIVRYDTRIDDDLKRQLERLTHSGSCSVQLICDNLR